MQFTDYYLKQKYKNKKMNAASRKIKFSLTESEFIKLCLFIKDNRICAYTGEKFVLSTTDNGNPKPNYPTLERIDNSKGYEIGNCVWVCHNANFLKSKWEDSQCNTFNFNKHEFKTVQQILTSQERVAEQLNNIYKFVKETEYNMVETKEQIQVSDAKGTNENSNQTVIYATNTEKSSVYSINEDVSLAVSYSQFAEHCQQHVDFYLSFNEYKKLMSRKKCQLTMQNFDEDHKRSLFVVDKTQPVNVSNLLVVDLKLRHNLDSFIGKVKLDNKDLKKIFKNLGEVMKG